MADKTKRTALAKYTVAAIAAVLIIGVAVTTVLIKAKRKDIVVIEANKESADSLEESFKSKEEKKSTFCLRRLLAKGITRVWWRR